MNEKTVPDHVTRVLRNGSVVVPATYIQRLGLEANDRVEIRITKQAVSRRLKVRGITDAEVDHMSRQQMESRENVLTFLSAEGVLAESGAPASRLRRWVRSGR